MTAADSIPQENETIGLIGLGLVGTAIAEVLLARGFEVVGFDIDEARRTHLTTLGGHIATSPREVAEAASRVVLSLLDSNIVAEVVEGPDGLIQAKEPPHYIIDTTTGDPEETIDLAKRLARRDIRLLDATISGSSEQLRVRDALFMVGGDRAAFEQCADILDALSERVVYLGSSGSGSKAKLASNLILGLNRLALAEGLVFAERLGLDLERFLKLLTMSPAYSVAVDAKGEKMLRQDFAAQSRIRQHHKDVALILKYAQKAGQELPLAQVHLEILEQAIAAGEGDLDNAAVIRQIARRRVQPRGCPDEPPQGEPRA